MIRFFPGEIPRCKVGDSTGDEGQYDFMDVEGRNFHLIKEHEGRDSHRDGPQAAGGISLLPV